MEKGYTALPHFVRDIFNRCLAEGAYSDTLKVAEVMPIFKKDRGETSNYYPISLLSQFNKVFGKLLPILEYRILLPNEQGRIQGEMWGMHLPHQPFSTMLCLNKVVL